jgi:hypothetical protein
VVRKLVPPQSRTFASVPDRTCPGSRCSLIVAGFLGWGDQGRFLPRLHPSRPKPLAWNIRSEHWPEQMFGTTVWANLVPEHFFFFFSIRDIRMDCWLLSLRSAYYLMEYTCSQLFGTLSGLSWLSTESSHILGWTAVLFLVLVRLILTISLSCLQ